MKKYWAKAVYNQINEYQKALNYLTIVAMKKLSID